LYKITNYKYQKRYCCSFTSTGIGPWPASSHRQENGTLSLVGLALLCVLPVRGVVKTQNNFLEARHCQRVPVPTMQVEAFM